ncbi:hypothetical protein V6N13_098490 [Hibiscus sabdariffa]
MVENRGGDEALAKAKRHREQSVKAGFDSSRHGECNDPRTANPGRDISADDKALVSSPEALEAEAWLGASQSGLIFRFRGVEETKINYLEQFLQHAANTARFHEQNNLTRNNIEAIAFLGWKGNANVIQGGNDFTLLGQLLDILRRSEQDIRSCYAENLKGIDSEEFLRLVLVDAAFIIELFLRYHFCSPDFDLWDVMLLPLYQFILIRSDLWLLENQIPYFVLENLYVTAFGSYPQIYPPFLELTFENFDIYNRWKMKPEAVKGKGIKHFTDLIRALYLRPLGNSEERHSNENMFCPLRDHLPSATQLHDGGVRFVETKGKSLVDINFSDSDGRLEIPSLHIWDETAQCFRNIIALEQYHYPRETYVSDYFTLMDYLINSSQDADLLVRKKVIKHWLGSSSEVTGLFNSLCIYILKGRINPHFFKIIEQLNRYHSRRLNRWKATLRQQYPKSKLIISII